MVDVSVEPSVALSVWFPSSVLAETVVVLPLALTSVVLLLVVVLSSLVPLVLLPVVLLPVVVAVAVLLVLLVAVNVLAVLVMVLVLAVLLVVAVLVVVPLVVLLLVVDVLMLRQFGTSSRSSCATTTHQKQANQHKVQRPKLGLFGDKSWQLTSALACKPAGQDGGQDSPTCNTCVREHTIVPSC